jgi:hypothetical protein
VALREEGQLCSGTLLCNKILGGIFRILEYCRNEVPYNRKLGEKGYNRKLGEKGYNRKLGEKGYNRKLGEKGSS